MKFIKKDSGTIIDGNGYSKEILAKDIDMISNQALAQIIRINPGDVAPNHYHKNTTEIFYFLEGSVDFKIDDQSFICNPGDLLICNQNEKHEVTNRSENIAKYIAFKTQCEDDTSWA